MGRAYRALLVLGALYLATCSALVLAPDGGGWMTCEGGIRGAWAACDQIRHIGQINYFIRNPTSFFHYPDDNLVATLPGFHLLVAALARTLGIDELRPDTWLRLIPCLFGLGALGLLWRTFQNLSNKSWYAMVLCLPILWSNYFYLSSLFLVTENPAYLGYVFLLMAYLRFPRRGFAIGLAGAGMVFARQIFLPVVATQLFAFPEGLLRRPFDPGRILAVASGILLPTAIVGTYLLAWGSLVPPEVGHYHAAHAIIELGPVIQAFGLLGVLAVPYGLLAYPALRRIGNRRIAAILAAAAAGAFALWAFAPSTRDVDAGRLGSFIWLLAQASPVFHERALLVLPCLFLGFAAVGVIIELARIRGYVPVELIMFLLYVAALSTQLLSYQRYSEVVTLIALSATAARFGQFWRPGASVFLTAYVAKLVITVSIFPAG